MVAPGSRAAIAHCKDVLDNLADSGVGIAPDFMLVGLMGSAARPDTRTGRL